MNYSLQLSWRTRSSKSRKEMPSSTSLRRKVRSLIPKDAAIRSNVGGDLSNSLAR